MAQTTTDDNILNIKQYTEKSIIVWGKEATIANQNFLQNDLRATYGKFWKKAKMKENGLTLEIPDDRAKDTEHFKGWMLPLSKRTSLISHLIMNDINYVNWDDR